MKKLISILIIISITGCSYFEGLNNELKNNAKKPNSSISNQQKPSSMYTQYLGDWGMILEQMKKKGYNPAGYLVFQPEGSIDEYGNENSTPVQAYPLVKASKRFVDEIRKFRDPYDIYKESGITSKSKMNKLNKYIVRSLKPYFNASQSTINSSTVFWDLPTGY